MRSSTPLPRFPKPAPGVLPGVAVEPRGNESPGDLIRRFSRLVQRSGVLGEMRRHCWHRTPSEARRRKHHANERRKAKQQRQWEQRQRRRRL